KLVLTHAESRRLHGEEHLSRPSRFIREIPSELLQEVRLKGRISRTTHYQRQSRGHGQSGRGMMQTGFDADETDNSSGISLGQRVRHPKFGEGVVLNCEGQGKNARVQINFDEVGGKWLVMAYAKLEAI